MQAPNLHLNNCSVARVFELIGEWWSMLLILELFSGSTQQSEFKNNLGISSSILSNRLNKLMKHDLVERFPLDSSDNRFGYRLTDKGRALLPAFVALHQWGNQWLEWPDGPALRIIEYASQKDIPPLRLRNEQGEMLFGGDIRLVADTGADALMASRFANRR